MSVGGTRQYLVDVNGKVRSVYVNHMLASHDTESLHKSCDSCVDDDFDLVSVPELGENQLPVEREQESEGARKFQSKNGNGKNADVMSGPSPTLSPTPRRSQRLRKPVDRLGY